DQPPVAVFVRGESPSAVGKASSGVVPIGVTGRSSPEVNLGGLSTARLKPIDPAGPPSGRLNPAPAPPPRSGTVRPGPGRGSGSVAGQSATRLSDPELWVRERVTDQLSKK